MSWTLDSSAIAPPGQSRFDFAKSALLREVSSLPDRSRLGLIVFPYQGACDPQLVVPVSSHTKQTLQSYIPTLAAPQTAPTHSHSNSGGGTPLAAAIQLACQTASQTGDDTTIVILTDGLETCGGDPVVQASVCRSQGVRITTNVIGYVVSASVRQQLQQIARAGGGSYADAQNARQLSKAVHRAARASSGRGCLLAYIWRIPLALIRLPFDVLRRVAEALVALLKWIFSLPLAIARALGGVLFALWRVVLRPLLMLLGIIIFVIFLLVIFGYVNI